MLGDAASDDAGTHDHDPRPTLHSSPPENGSHTNVFEICCAWRIPFLYTAQLTQGEAGVKELRGSSGAGVGKPSAIGHQQWQKVKADS
jgi:hypothetical protein